MADRYKVILPGKITIEVDGEAETDATRKPVPHPASTGSSQGILEGRGRAGYLRRGGGLDITFYDLGTRLRSRTVDTGGQVERRIRLRTETDKPVRLDGAYNEYVEQEIEYPLAYADKMPQAFAPSLTVSDEVNAQVEAALLGSRVAGSMDTLDPFGMTPANGSGREIGNCWQIPYDATELFIDIYYQDSRREDYIPLTPPNRRPKVEEYLDIPPGRPLVASDKWQEREAESTDSLENWNTVNLEEGGALKGGFINYKSVSGKATLRSRTIGFYEEFNMTGNKITEQQKDGDGNYLTPSPLDPQATDPHLRAGDKVRVYLRPKTVFFCAHLNAAYRLAFDPVTGGSFFKWGGVASMFAGRMPVYPFWPGKRLRDALTGEIIEDDRYPKLWGKKFNSQPLRISGRHPSYGQKLPPLPYNHYINRVPAASSRPYGELWRISGGSGIYLAYGLVSSSNVLATYFTEPTGGLPPDISLREGFFEDEHYYHGEEFLYKPFLTGAYTKNNKVFYMWNNVTAPPTPLVRGKPGAPVLHMDTRITDFPFYEAVDFGA